MPIDKTFVVWERQFGVHQRTGCEGAIVLQPIDAHFKESWDYEVIRR